MGRNGRIIATITSHAVLSVIRVIIGSMKVRSVKKPKKPSIAQLDKLWAEIVKKQAGSRCEVCGKTTGLNSHHLFSRHNMGMRWNVSNGVSLCVSHHVFGNFSAHLSPLEFTEWIKEKRGEEWYKQLRRQAQEVYKPNYSLIYTGLKEILYSIIVK